MKLTVLKAVLKELKFSDVTYEYYDADAIVYAENKACFVNFLNCSTANYNDNNELLHIILPKTPLGEIESKSWIASFKFDSEENFEIVKKIFEEFDYTLSYKEFNSNENILTIKSLKKRKDPPGKGEKILVCSLSRMLYERSFTLLPFIIRRLIKKHKELTYFQALTIAYTISGLNFVTYESEHFCLATEIIVCSSTFVQIMTHKNLYTAEEFYKLFVQKNIVVKQWHNNNRIKTILNISDILKMFPNYSEERREATSDRTGNESFKFRYKLYKQILLNNEKIPSIGRYFI